MLKSLFTVLFSTIIIITSWAQNVRQLESYADEMFAEGMYHLAAREYQRALFFGVKENVGPLSVKTGDCYFEIGDFDSALNYYAFASNILKDGLQKEEAFLRRASCQLYLKNYNQAIFTLLSIKIFSEEALRKKRNLLLGVAYFGLREDQKSQEELLKIIDSTKSEKRIMVEDLFNSRKLKWPNPDVAYWLSVIVPGSGQFYAGDFKNGLNSMLLNGALIYTSYWMAGRYSVWDALLTIYPWWQRYYAGGYKSAIELAKRKKMKNREEIYKQIFEVIKDEL